MHLNADRLRLPLLPTRSFVTTHSLSPNLLYGTSIVLASGTDLACPSCRHDSWNASSLGKQNACVGFASESAKSLRGLRMHRFASPESIYFAGQHAARALQPLSGSAGPVHNCKTSRIGQIMSVAGRKLN